MSECYNTKTDSLVGFNIQRMCNVKLVIAEKGSVKTPPRCVHGWPPGKKFDGVKIFAKVMMVLAHSATSCDNVY